FRIRDWLQSLGLCRACNYSLRSDALQQVRSWLFMRVLRYELTAHGEIKNEAPKARHRVRCVSDAFVVPKQTFRVHRASASAKIVFNCLRSFSDTASASFSFPSSLSGLPYSSATACGFFMSRL